MDLSWSGNRASIFSLHAMVFQAWMCLALTDDFQIVKSVDPSNKIRLLVCRDVIKRIKVTSYIFLRLRPATICHLCLFFPQIWVVLSDNRSVYFCPEAAPGPTVWRCAGLHCEYRCRCLCCACCQSLKAASRHLKYECKCVSSEDPAQWSDLS